MTWSYVIVIGSTFSLEVMALLVGISSWTDGGFPRRSIPLRGHSYVGSSLPASSRSIVLPRTARDAARGRLSDRLAQ